MLDIIRILDTHGINTVKVDNYFSIPFGRMGSLRLLLIIPLQLLLPDYSSEIWANKLRFHFFPMDSWKTLAFGGSIWAKLL